MDQKTTRQEPKYPDKPIDLSPDPNTNELIARILDRDKEGLDKFGISMREKMLRNPRDCVFWLHNALEESIDFSRYGYFVIPKASTDIVLPGLNRIIIKRKSLASLVKNSCYLTVLDLQ